MVMNLLKVVPIFIAAMLIGNWFLSEVRKAKMTGAPWYTPYLTIPGALVVLFAVVAPIAVWWLQQ